MGKWGQELRGIRERAGLTQAQLAKAAGLQQSVVARLEKREGPPREGTVEKLRVALPGLSSSGRAKPKTEADRRIEKQQPRENKAGFWAGVAGGGKPPKTEADKRVEEQRRDE